MSNKVKWMHNGFAGAPVLTNNWGSLTALLDACLVNGFNLKTVTALSRTDDTATATIGSGHGFMVDQVVLVEGCDQPSYNGEFTITAITSTTVSFRVPGEPASPATTQTGITLKIAPLGFEIAFTGTHKRAYRSPNPQSNRHFLRVDDSLPTGYTSTWAKFGRVTIAEGMSDIDTFVGAQAPFTPAAPTRNEVPTGSGTTMYAEDPAEIVWDVEEGDESPRRTLERMLRALDKPVLVERDFRPQAAPQEPRCECDLRTRLVGDGCAVCNRAPRDAATKDHECS